MKAIERRIQGMEEWLANPSLMRADKDAEYAEVIEIDLDSEAKAGLQVSVDAVKELLVACKGIDSNLG